MSDVKVKGLAELQAALAQLPVKMENNILRAALRAGCKIIAKQAADNVKSVSGSLAASVRFGVDTNKNKNGKLAGYVRAGARGKRAKKGLQPNAAFYAHMVEQGTAAHIIKARAPNRMLAIGVAQVQHPGAKKKPFLRPAMDNQGQAALAVMREYIRARLASKHGIDVPAPVDPAADE
jgi:HK97 gp10 family phage protein